MKRVWRFFILSLFGTLLIAGCGGDGDSGVTAPPPAANPVKASITAPAAIALNQDILISGEGSISPNATALTYQWSVVQAPAPGSAVLTSAQGKTARLKAVSEGSYKVSLTVSDGVTADTTEKTLVADLDGDGLLGSDDNDSDGDGVLNTADAFPDKKVEWIDSDGDGIGNYADSDEDNDDVDDSLDAYPFDAQQSVLAEFPETEFNGNINDANVLSGTYPALIRGTLEPGSTYTVDDDYFRFAATRGDIVTVALSMTGSAFEPVLAILDTNGLPLPSVEGQVGPLVGDVVASLRIPADGNYTVVVSDKQSKANPAFGYELRLIKDSDMDGLADDLELAMGMLPDEPDADGDGIGDGEEFFADKGSFDIDGDGLPAWWDNDSDMDGITDQLEGPGDADADRIPNFLDIDSDANDIPDESEAGINPNFPLDLDGDGSPDYLDSDDDNDGIVDSRDPDRNVVAIPSGLLDPQQRVMLSDVVATIVDPSSNQGYQIKEIARAGDLITLNGEGFSTSATVLLQTPSATENITPVTVSANQLTFALPASIQPGRVSIAVGSGSKVSNALDLIVVSATHPVLYPVIAGKVMPGDSLTLSGQNLAANTVNVVFGTVAAGVNSWEISNTALTVTVPPTAESGDLRVVALGTSNPVDLKVTREISGIIDLPTESTLVPSALQAEFGTDKVAIDATGAFRLPVLNQGTSSVTVFAPTDATHKPAVFLSATVLAGQTSVTMNPQSTATDIVFGAMGLESSIERDDHAAALAIVASSVTDFTKYLDQNLGSNSYFLEDYLAPGLQTQIINAVGAAGAAIDQAIANETIHLAPKVTAALARLAAVSTGNPDIQPAFSQEDFVVSFVNAGTFGTGALNGKINIENDTMLFADVEARDAFNSKVLPGNAFVDRFFSTDLLGPQNGLWGGYWGSDKQMDLRYRSAILTVRTPGLRMESWNDYYNSPSFKLALRTFLSQAVVPVVNTVVGVNASDSKTDLILRVLFDFGVFDGIEQIWTNGDFVGGVGQIVKKTLQTQILEKLVKAVAEAYLGTIDPEDVVKLAAKLGLKLTPWGSAATVVSVGGTAIDLGALAVDMTTTHSKIEFKVLFPVAIETISPTAIQRDDTNKQVKLQGPGIGPATFKGTRYTPSVVFRDSKGNEYEETNPIPSTFLIPVGAAAPNDELTCTLPATWLKDAEGPITVTLHHHHIDYTLINEIYPVTLDAPNPIELVDNLTLSAIAPDKGGWGDKVELTGAGFSDNLAGNTVYFTGPSGSQIPAGITAASSTTLSAIVPKDAETGPVWVEVNGESSNTLVFTVEQSLHTFTIGDNGSATDDTFALYIDGQLVISMGTPATSVSAVVPLTNGTHSVTMRGITAPDSIGTYYITFPNTVTVLSGDAQTGSDMTAGVTKTWTIETTGGQAQAAANRAVTPQIRWKE